MVENLFPLMTKHLMIKPIDNKRLWDEEWIISLRAENTDESKDIGKLHFEEAGLNGEVKMFVDLESAYDKEKFIKEIFYSMAVFVFRYADMREISTVCRHENDHRVRGLEKAGFVLRSFKDGNDYYSMKKQKSSWTGFYVIIGLIAGFVIGITISNLWVGTIAGVIIGVIFGYLLDKKDGGMEPRKEERKI